MCTTVNNLDCSVPWAPVCGSPWSWFVILFQLTVSWKIYLHKYQFELTYLLVEHAWMMTTLTKNNPCKLGIFFKLLKRQVIKYLEPVRKGKGSSTYKHYSFSFWYHSTQATSSSHENPSCGCLYYSEVVLKTASEVSHLLTPPICLLWYSCWLSSNLHP